MPRLLAIVAALLLGLAGPPAAAAMAAVPWRWPVDPPRSIVRPYLAPATPYAAGHRGVDIRAPTGVLYAPADGIVHFAGLVVDRPVLSIGHGDGVISSFEPVVAAVREGDVVARGQVIGTVMPGHCSMLCVHVGVRVHGQYVSPLAFFGSIPASVLLPTRRA
ncbi:MAG: M23 family metallopeptidase [Rhodoglobus sp.]